MKPAFFILAVLLTTAAAAQDLSIPGKKKNSFQFYKMDRKRDTTFRLAGITVPPQRQLLAVLPNKSKVYALPQDKMPCIIPDMNQFNMPNPGKTNQIIIPPAPGSIPNSPLAYNNHIQLIRLNK